jgi:hypothetical protein
LQGTGKSEKITITAEKGRLSQEDIERMVQEAEEFAEVRVMCAAVRFPLGRCVRSPLMLFQSSLSTASSRVLRTTFSLLRSVLCGAATLGVLWLLTVPLLCCRALLQEDKKVKDRIDSRNGLEGYCYNLKNMLEDTEKGLADKLSEDEKKTIETAVQETLDWVDENQEAEAEDFKEKQKEIGTTRVSVVRCMRVLQRRSFLCARGCLCVVQRRSSTRS